MKPLRNASSLILVAKNNLLKNLNSKCSDINVLTLKRSATASHFPDSYVFPGGNCDPADEISEWLTLFPPSELDVQMNLNNDDFKSSNQSKVSLAISRRITAIRETFEECGILLCKREQDPTKFYATDLPLENKEIWRTKIQNDAFQFFYFCQTHNCFPNLKSLHFLSNWVTPKSFLRRYNSKFFIAALEHEIDGKPDLQEIQEVKWGSVNYFLENENIFLPPPQMYELTRLQKFENFDTLRNFIMKLDGLISDPYLPVHVNTSDGLIMILPGDEKYEQYLAVSSENTINSEDDIATLRDSVMNRVEYHGAASRGVVTIQNVITHKDSTSSSAQSKL